MRSKTISVNIVWKFLERFTAQIVSFVVSLVLARILLVEDYGIVSLVLVFIEIADAFITGGLGNALIQKKDADEIDFSSIFYFNIGLSLVLYLILFFLAPFLSSFFKQQLLVPVIRVFGIRLILASINSIQQAYVSKQMQFKKFFLATLVGTIISGVFGIYLAVKGYGVWALVFQYLSNSFIDTVILFFSISWRPRFLFSWKRVLALLSYGWKIIVEAVANALTGQLRALIIGKVYTESDLAYYTKAQQFPTLIMGNINSSISAVLFPAMSNVQDRKTDLLFLLRRSARISSYILFPMMFGLAAVSTNLVTVLLTEKWLPCVPFIIILCFSHVVTIGMYPRHQAMKAIGRSDVYMMEHMISRVVNIIVLLCVYKISVLAIALSGVGGTLLLAAIIMFTSKKYTGYQYHDQVFDIIGVLISSLIMFVSVYLLGFFLEINTILELVLQVLLGVILYGLYSLVFKPEGFIFLISFLHNRTNHKEV